MNRRAALFLEAGGWELLYRRWWHYFALLLKGSLSNFEQGRKGHFRLLTVSITVATTVSSMMYSIAQRAWREGVVNQIC